MTAKEKRKIQQTLIEVLTQLYETEKKIRLISNFAGVNMHNVDFHGSAKEMWFSVTSEASKQGVRIFINIIDETLKDYPQSDSASLLLEIKKNLENSLPNKTKPNPIETFKRFEKHPKFKAFFSIFIILSISFIFIFWNKLAAFLFSFFGTN